MFWALNGATFTPRRASSRHSPVTTWLFPASLVVPQIMMAPRITPAPCRHVGACSPAAILAFGLHSPRDVLGAVRVGQVAGFRIGAAIVWLGSPVTVVDSPGLAPGSLR